MLFLVVENSGWFKEMLNFKGLSKHTTNVTTYSMEHL
jgi:hypothetical protein